MRSRLALLPLVVTATVSAVLLAGCNTQDPAAAPTASTPTRAPALGGRVPQPQSVPTTPMNRLEKPVQQRLAAQVARQGLTLQYLDCPHWDGVVPSRMTCRAYVDGLVAPVAVRLRATIRDKAVDFDAWMLDGLIATRNLEGTLRRQGWTQADCGRAAAYPARVGSRIVCRVVRPGRVKYVVATVSDRQGAVMIADYRSAG